MHPPEKERRHFFVSFNSADRAYAEWIAAELEAAEKTVQQPQQLIGHHDRRSLPIEKPKRLLNLAAQRVSTQRITNHRLPAPHRREVRRVAQRIKQHVPVPVLKFSHSFAFPFQQPAKFPSV